jgi:broad specificity phosphatase PhoE
LLLVAHGGPLQVLVCLALGLPPEKYWQFHLSPGSLSEIAIYPQGGIVNLLNEEMEPQMNADKR